MPLQANARKNNNSVFIDEHFQPYDDQWSFLSNIGILSGEEIKGASDEATNAIFDNHNFMAVFCNDVSSAKSDMVIVSPYMTKKCLSQMMNILSTGINNGAKLTIIIRSLR